MKKVLMLLGAVVTFILLTSTCANEQTSPMTLDEGEEFAVNYFNSFEN